MLMPGITARRARQEFRATGFAKVGFLLAVSLRESVGAEVLRLVERAGVRRDLRFAETGNTPRRMRNVRQAEIDTLGTVIPRVYESTSLRKALSTVAGEPLLPCPYLPERYVITRLERSGDTHGWHWDDYAFALVWVIECPPSADGGSVQGVPHTRWNKHDAGVDRILAEGPIHSWQLRPGDAYLLRTDTTMHRVEPIRRGRRTILNMAFASRHDLTRSVSHETMDNLWADPCPDNEDRLGAGD